ncbi:MAG: hypothetical protein HQK79_15735, partial [Desulfobacterales bacterium]|nr:hypothetical protein [Desulfobacterales bacterium]
MAKIITKASKSKSKIVFTLDDALNELFKDNKKKAKELRLRIDFTEDF